MLPKVTVKFNLHNLWVGVYWKTGWEATYPCLDIYICILPTLPIWVRFEWWRK